jgi:Las1-like
MAPAKSPIKLSTKRHFKRICDAVQSIPFWDWKEHDQVGLALVHHRDDFLSTEEALERVAVWKTRSTKIAHAIESTAALVQILLRDQEQRRSSVISTTELRHAYASAILRSVNGLADSLQQQRFAASSVAVLCTELGVPPWLVAIRHEATHNQLPPLPTLRMAAEALVQYFSTVYWEPTRERHEQQYEHAWSILCQYEAAAIDREQSRLQIPSENQIDVDDTRAEETNSDSDKDNGDDEILEVDGLLQSPLGTTSNRFAALVEKKTKIDKAASSKDVPAEQPPLKKPKIEPNDFVKRNQIVAACAKRFAMTESHVDVLHRVAIDFLVARSHENATLTNAESVENGVLLQRFRVLLSTLGRSWPGFLSAFLRACVKQIVDLECGQWYGNSPPEEVTEVCSIFESWVHVLLSRKFLSFLERKTEKTEAKANFKLNDMTTFAAFETLQSLQYPLNRLCDELLGETGMDNSFHRSPDLVRYRLADAMMNILGDSRLPNYGIDLTTAGDIFRTPSSLKPQTTKPLVYVSTTPFSMNSRSALTLEAMEALLDDINVNGAVRSLPLKNACHIDESDGSGEPATKLREKVPLWLQCQSWEPCAIGSSSCLLE